MAGKRTWDLIITRWKISRWKISRWTIPQWTLVSLAIALCCVLPITGRAQKMMSVQTVAVPDFTGKTLDQVRAVNDASAQKKPIFAGIDAQGTANGVVAVQNPRAGTLVVAGTTRLLVTLGSAKPSLWQQLLNGIAAAPQQTTAVPNLEGLDRARAVSLIAAARLRGNFTGAPNGSVTAQSPAAGSIVKAGSQVLVDLATPQPSVPSLVGRTQADAERILQAVSLRLGAVLAGGGEGATVLAQSIAAGTRVAAGTAVSVRMTAQGSKTGDGSNTVHDPQNPPVNGTVASTVGATGDRLRDDKPQVLVPDLTGMPAADAEAALKAVDLAGRSLSKGGKGLVSQQFPEPGTRVDLGAQVTYRLRAQTVVVPNVLQDGEEDAAQRLRIFGLLPEVTLAEHMTSGAPRIVTSQYPAAGVKVPAGSSVTLTIGTAESTAWRSWWPWLALGLILSVGGGVGFWQAGKKVTDSLAQHPVVDPPPALIPAPAPASLPVGVLESPTLPAVLPIVSPRAAPLQAQTPAVIATPTLVAGVCRATIHLGTAGGPAVRFSIGLRDKQSAPQWIVPSQPAATWKESQR